MVLYSISIVLPKYVLPTRLSTSTSTVSAAPIARCHGRTHSSFNAPEEPICQEHTSSVSGILIGTEGEVSIEVEQGFNTATSYTVTSKPGTSVFDPYLKLHSNRCIYHRCLVYPQCLYGHTSSCGYQCRADGKH